MHTAVNHASADQGCGRSWQCSCGPCRAGREAGFATLYDLLAFGSREIGRWEDVQRGNAPRASRLPHEPDASLDQSKGEP